MSGINFFTDDIGVDPRCCLYDDFQSSTSIGGGRTGTRAFHYTNKGNDIPKGAENHVFYYGDIPVRFHVFRAPNQRHLIADSSGFKYPMAFTENTLQDASQNGSSVINMELPVPGRSLDFMEVYEDITDFFFFDRESPVFTLFDPKLPKTMWGHSTGGLLVASKLYDDEKSQLVRDRGYRSAVCDAAFFDCAGAAIENHPLWQEIFDYYASLYPDNIPMETLAGAFHIVADQINIAVKTGKSPLPSSWAGKAGFAGAYVQTQIMDTLRLRFNHPMGDKSSYRRIQSETDCASPTYAQIQELRLWGRMLSIYSSAEPRHSPVPTIFTSGEWDRAASSLSIDTVARNFSAKHLRAKAGHQPIEDDANVRRAVFDMIEQAIPQPRARTERTHMALSVLGKGWGEGLPSLAGLPARLVGASVGGLRQLPARLANTAASFL